MKTAGVSAAWQVTWPAGVPSGADPISASLRPASLSLAWDPKTDTVHRWVLRTLGLGDTLWTRGLDHQITWGVVEFENLQGLLVCQGFKNFLEPYKIGSALLPLLLGPHRPRLSVALWSLTTLACGSSEATPGCLCTRCSPFPPGACWGPPLSLLWNAISPVKPSLITLFTFAYCSLLALPPDLFWVMFLHHTHHYDHNIAALTGHLRFSWHAITNIYLP